MQLPLRKILKNGTAIELAWMCPQEEESVRALLNTVIIEGKIYPQDQPLSEVEFAAYWLSQDAFVVRAIENTKAQQLEYGKVLGTFYLNPTFQDAVAIFVMLVLLYNLCYGVNVLPLFKGGNCVGFVKV